MNNIDKPTFSIITVTLNPGKTALYETVKSVISQDFNDWELIIKDGGSTDGSLICLPQDDRIKIAHRKDTGIFDAMNQALELASGQFICFLNAGDIFIESTTLTMVNEVVRSHPNVGFIYGDVCKPLSRSGYELYPSRLSRYYLFKYVICHQAWFVRRGYYISVGGYETKYPSGADHRFLLRMVLKHRVNYHHLPRIVVSYKGEGISKKTVNITNAKKWTDDIRRELFGKLEYITYSFIWNFRDVLKLVIYDYLFYKIWRKVQFRRAKVRNA